MDAYPALAALLFEHLAVPMVSAPELLATANISGKISSWRQKVEVELPSRSLKREVSPQIRRELKAATRKGWMRARPPNSYLDF